MVVMMVTPIVIARANVMIGAMIVVSMATFVCVTVPRPFFCSSSQALMSVPCACGT